MSVSKWKWTPECDKGICVGDCDQCDRSEPVFGEWISVNEKLPKTEDHVLCCTETKNGRKNVVIGYYMDGWRCGMNSNVIAWMPLPEPYGGES